jgi:hypothetical protein
VQLNKGHKHTDDFITKKYILPMLRDPQKLKSLIEEHRATPIGRAATRDHGVIQHSQDLQTLLDKLRRGSKENGFVTICLKLHEDYKMLRITGYSDKYTSFPGEEIKFYVNAEKMKIMRFKL